MGGSGPSPMGCRMHTAVTTIESLFIDCEDLHRFDRESDTWHDVDLVEPHPGWRRGHVSVFVPENLVSEHAGRIFLHGGRYANQSHQDVIHDDIWSYRVRWSPTSVAPLEENKTLDEILLITLIVSGLFGNVFGIVVCGMKLCKWH